MMDRRAALIWRKPLPDWRQRMTTCVYEAAAARTTATRIFFRADDVAVPGERFREMIGLFEQHGVPLNLAVVPAWLTAPRWRALKHAGRAAAHLWCWHQHGWRHHNHEPRGKKQEFGPARSPGALRRDLERGRRRLEALMGPSFFPVFTPPLEPLFDPNPARPAPDGLPGRFPQPGQPSGVPPRVSRCRRGRGSAHPQRYDARCRVGGLPGSAGPWIAAPGLRADAAPSAHECQRPRRVG